MKKLLDYSMLTKDEQNKYDKLRNKIDKDWGIKADLYSKNADNLLRNLLTGGINSIIQRSKTIYIVTTQMNASDKLLDYLRPYVYKFCTRTRVGS